MTEFVRFKDCGQGPIAVFTDGYKEFALDKKSLELRIENLKKQGLGYAIEIAVLG
jgi:hypothetical protein